MLVVCNLLARTKSPLPLPSQVANDLVELAVVKASEVQLADVKALACEELLAQKHHCQARKPKAKLKTLT